MTDAIVTYGLVAGAALYVVWKLFLPQSVKMRIRLGLTGRTAPCPLEPRTSSCPVGCSGCALAAPRKRS
tara:strand:- start:7678 stop:7884 length:207 start_codon:yes stop_codon:yes gene_type:complete